MQESTTPLIDANAARDLLLNNSQPSQEELPVDPLMGEPVDQTQLVNQEDPYNQGPGQAPVLDPVAQQQQAVQQQQQQQGQVPQLFPDAKNPVTPTQGAAGMAIDTANSGAYANSNVPNYVKDKIASTSQAAEAAQNLLGNPEAYARNDIQDSLVDPISRLDAFDRAGGADLDAMVRALSGTADTALEVVSEQDRTWAEAAGDTAKALGVGVLNFTDIVPVLGQLGAMSMGERDSVFTSWMEGSEELKNQIRGSYSSVVQSQDYLTNRASQQRKAEWEAANPNATTAETLKFELKEFANTIGDTNYESTLNKIAENAPDLLASLVGYGYLKGGAEKAAKEIIEQKAKGLAKDFDAVDKGDFSSAVGKEILRDKDKGPITPAMEESLTDRIKAEKIFGLRAEQAALKEGLDKKAAFKASLIGQGTAIAQEAGGSAASIRNEIASMSEEDLAKSPEYDKLIKSGLTHEEARSELANRAMARVAAIVGGSQAVIGKVSGAFDAPIKAMGGFKGIKNSVLGIAGAAGKEGGEETAIAAASTLAEGKTKQDLVDPDQRITENLGRNIAEGLVVGSTLGAGVTTAAEASNIFRSTKDVVDDGAKKVKTAVSPEGDGGYSLAKESSDEFAQILDNDALSTSDTKDWKENTSEFTKNVDNISSSEDFEPAQKKEILFTAAKQAETAATKAAADAERFEKEGDTDKADVARARSDVLRNLNQQILEIANGIKGVSTSQQAKIDAEQGTIKGAIKGASRKVGDVVGSATSVVTSPIKKGSAKISEAVDKFKKKSEIQEKRAGYSSASTAFNKARGNNETTPDGAFNAVKKKAKNLSPLDKLASDQGLKAKLEAQLEEGSFKGEDRVKAEKIIAQIDKDIKKQVEELGIGGKAEAAANKARAGKAETITAEESEALFDQVSLSPDAALTGEGEGSVNVADVLLNNKNLSNDQKQYIQQILSYQRALSEFEKNATKEDKTSSDVNRDIRKGGLDKFGNRKYWGIADYAQDIQLALTNGDADSIKYSLGKLRNFINIQKQKAQDKATKANPDTQLSPRTLTLLDKEIALLTAFEAAMQRRISNTLPDFQFDIPTGGLNTDKLTGDNLGTTKITKSKSKQVWTNYTGDREAPTPQTITTAVELAIDSILKTGFTPEDPKQVEALEDHLLNLNESLNVDQVKAAKKAIELIRSGKELTDKEKRKALSSIYNVYRALTSEFGNFKGLMDALLKMGDVEFNAVNDLLNASSEQPDFDAPATPTKMVYKKVEEIEKASDTRDTSKAINATFKQLADELIYQSQNNPDKLTEEDKEFIQDLVDNPVNLLDPQFVTKYNKMTEIVNRERFEWYEDFDVNKGERFENPHESTRVFQQDIDETDSGNALHNFTANVEEAGLLQTEDNLFQKLADENSSLTEYVNKHLTRAEAEALTDLALKIAGPSAFAVNFEGMFKTPSTNKNTDKVVNIKNSPMMEFIRSDGSISTSVAAVIALSSFNWLQRRGTQVLFNEEDTIRAITRTKDGETIQKSMRSAYMQGVTMETFVNEVGADVIRNMGMKLLPEHQQHLMEDLITSAGQMVLKGMETNNLVHVTYVHKLKDANQAGPDKPLYIRKSDTAPEAGYESVNKLVIPTTQTGKPKKTGVKTTEADLDNEKSSFQLSDYNREIVDDMTLLSKVMDDMFGLKGVTQQAIPGTAKLEAPTVGTDGTPVSTMQREALENYINIEYGIDPHTFELFMALGDDYIIENFGGMRASGITPKELEHEDNRDRNEANRESMREQIRVLRELKEALDTGDFDGVVKFKSIVGQNKRMTMLGISPQSSRLWREIVKPTAFKLKIDPTSTDAAELAKMRSLKEAIAAAMGFDTDKQGDAKTIADYDSLMNNQDVMNAVAEIREATEKGRTPDMEIVKIAFGGKSPSPEQVQGLSALSAVETDKPFEVNIGKENDGVTNGLAFNLMQMAPADNFDDFIKRANRVGILSNDGTDFGQHLEKDDNEDSYEDLLSVIKNYLANPEDYSSELPSVKKSTLKLGGQNLISGKVKTVGVNTEEDFKELAASVGLFLNKKGRKLTKEALEETSLDPGAAAVRDLAKDPLMQFLYGAGIKGLQLAMIHQAYSGILNTIEQAAAIEDPAAREEAFSAIELAVRKVTSKMGYGSSFKFQIDRANPLKSIDTKTSQKILAGLEVSLKLTYGKALDVAFKSKYAMAKKLGDRLVAATRIAAKVYVAIWNKREKEILKENKQISLTNEQKRELQEELKAYRPMYETPMSDEDNDAMDGVYGLKRINQSQSRTVKSTYKTPKDNVDSVNTHNHRMVDSDPEVSMGPMLIQSYDASVIANGMLKEIFVSVHDAIIADTATVTNSTLGLNEAFTTIVSQNQLFAVVEQRLAQTMSYPGIESGQFDAEIKEAMSDEAFQMGLNDEFLDDPDAADNLLSFLNATSQAIENNKNLMAKTGMTVNEYFGNSETAYVVEGTGLTIDEAREAWERYPEASEFTTASTVEATPAVNVVDTESGKQEVEFILPENRRFSIGITGDIKNEDINGIVDTVIKFVNDNAIPKGKLQVAIYSNVTPAMYQILQDALLWHGTALGLNDKNIRKISPQAPDKPITIPKKQYKTVKDKDGKEKRQLVKDPKLNQKKREAIKKLREHNAKAAKSNQETLTKVSDVIIVSGNETSLTTTSKEEDTYLKIGKPVIRRSRANNNSINLFDEFIESYTDIQAKALAEAERLQVVAQLGFSRMTQPIDVDDAVAEEQGFRYRPDFWDGKDVLKMTRDEIIAHLKEKGVSDTKTELKNAHNVGLFEFEKQNASNLIKDTYAVLGGSYKSNRTKNEAVKNALLKMYDTGPKFDSRDTTYQLIEEIFRVLGDSVTITTTSVGALRMKATKEGQNVNGYYDPSTNTVYIRDDIQDDGFALRSVLFEELDHAASGIAFRQAYGQKEEGALPSDQDGKDAIQSVEMLEAIWEQLEYQRDLAATGDATPEIAAAIESASRELKLLDEYKRIGGQKAVLEELMAWGKTNYNMAALLKKIQIRKKTGWQRLIEAVSSLLKVFKVVKRKVTPKKATTGKGKQTAAQKKKDSAKAKAEKDRLKKIPQSELISAYELLIVATQPFYNATAKSVKQNSRVGEDKNTLHRNIIDMPAGISSVSINTGDTDVTIGGELTAEAKESLITELKTLDLEYVGDPAVNGIVNQIFEDLESGQTLEQILNGMISGTIVNQPNSENKRRNMAAISIINGLNSVSLNYFTKDKDGNDKLVEAKSKSSKVLSSQSRGENMLAAINNYRDSKKLSEADKDLVQMYEDTLNKVLDGDTPPTVGQIIEAVDKLLENETTFTKAQNSTKNALKTYIRNELSKAVAEQSKEVYRNFLQINDNAEQFTKLTGDVTNDRLGTVFDGLGAINDTVRDAPEHTEHLSSLLDEMAPVVNSLKLSLTEALDDSASAGESKTTKQMLSSIDLTIQTRAKAHSLQMSAQELFVHEVGHTVIHNSNRRNKAWKVIEEQFKEARKQLKPEHFLTDVVGATKKDKEIAKATYDHIFINSVGSTQYKTRLGMQKAMFNDDPLAEFAIMAWTNHTFRKALANMAADQNGEGSKNEKEQNMYRKLAKLFGQIIGSFTKDVISNENAGADVKLMEALTYIIGAENQKRNSAYNAKRLSESGLDVLDEKMKEIAARGNRNVGKFLRGRDNKLFRNVGRVMDTLDPDFRDEAVDGYRKVMNAVGAVKSDTLVAVYNELTTGRKSLAEVSRLLAASSQMIEQNPLKLQSYIATELPENFQKDLTDHEKASISTLLEMDTGYLLNNGYNYDKLVEIIRSPEKAQEVIDDLFKALKASELPGIGKMSRYLRAHSEDLGYHLLTYGRKYPAGMYTNAYQIAHLDGFPRDEIPKGWDAAKVEPYIDELASLYAIRTLQESKYAEEQYKSIVTLLETEKRGMASTLVTHDVISQDAKERLFEDDSRQMRKGYLRNKNNSNIEVTTGTAAEHADLTAIGYTRIVDESGKPRQVYTDPTGADRSEPKYYYSIKNGSNNAHLSGAMSLAAKGSRGINIIDINTHPGKDADLLTTIRDTERLKKEKAKLLLDMARTGGKQLPVAKRGSVAQPTFDTNGNVQSYRYPMTRRVMDEVMQPDRDFSQLMGITAASNMKRENTTKINEQMLNYMYDTFVREFQKFPDEFIRISPNSAKKDERDAWFKMPKEARDQALKMWGGQAVYVKRTEFDIVFGYKKFSVGDLRYKTVDEEAALLNHLMTWLNNFAAFTFANKYGIGLETVLQETVRMGKDAIVIKTGVVTAANIMSNLMLLRMRGIPLSQSVPDTIEAYKAAWEYREDERELFSLKMKVQRGALTPRVELEMKSDIAVLQNKIQNNPVRELMEAGVFQSIVEDVDTLKESPLTEEYGVVEKIEKYVPKPIQNVGKFAMMTHDTKVYSVFRDMAQFSDFAARYSNHKYNMGKGMSFEDSINDIMTTFINYDIPQTKAMQYLNDMGVLSFTKYMMRVQQVILKTFAERPATFLGTALLSDMLSMVHYQMGASIDDGLIGFNSMSQQFRNSFGVITAGSETAPINLAMATYQAI